MSEGVYNLDSDSGTVHFNIQPFAHTMLIEYEAGLVEQPAQIPTDIKLALLSHIAFLYENRGGNERFDMSVYNEYKNYNL